MNSAGDVSSQDPVDLAILVGKTVLVVEDDALIAMVLEDLLADAGMTLAGSAQSVDEAIAHLGKIQPDIAILDANLDGRNSESVADLLQQRGVPFIFATGYTTSEMQQRFPGVPILQKPYRQDELFVVMATLFAPPGPRAGS